MTLPYPGYSWSFNHHMGRINPKEVFFLLSAAYEFGKHSDYRTLVNQFLVSQEVFTRFAGIFTVSNVASANFLPSA